MISSCVLPYSTPHNITLYSVYTLNYLGIAEKCKFISIDEGYLLNIFLPVIDRFEWKADFTSKFSNMR